MGRGPGISPLITMKIAIIQQSCSADIEANKQKLAHNIRTAAQRNSLL